MYTQCFWCFPLLIVVVCVVISVTYGYLLIPAICMIVACAAFPFGWNSDDFRKICGPEANRFELGLCGIRWAYPLAIIGCIDGVVLATLAFILATRHVRLQPDPIYQNSLYKGGLCDASFPLKKSTCGLIFRRWNQQCLPHRCHQLGGLEEIQPTHNWLEFAAHFAGGSAKRG